MELSSFNLFFHIYLVSVIAVIGLCVGSFLNVAGLRLLSEESIVFPGSKCPKCSYSLKWYDNIPVLSYLFLRGKCRSCKAHISIQYPIVELSTALLFVGIFECFGITLKSFFLLILASALIVITITDLREKLIYDWSSIPLIPIGLIYSFFDIGNSGLGTVTYPLEGINSSITFNEIFISAIIGAIIGAAFFEIFSRIGYLTVGEYAFGGGDSIIGAALGAWFGWKMILIILLFSFLFQLVVGLPVLIHNMYKDKDYKSIIFTGVLVCSMFIIPLGNYIGLEQHSMGFFLAVLISFSLAIVGMVVILQRTKEKKSFTFLPFGPALVLGGFLVMFMGQSLLDLTVQTIF